jgi:hypothetical protein
LDLLQKGKEPNPNENPFTGESQVNPEKYENLNMNSYFRSTATRRPITILKKLQLNVRSKET